MATIVRDEILFDRLVERMDGLYMLATFRLMIRLDSTSLLTIWLSRMRATMGMSLPLPIGHRYDVGSR